MNTRQQYSNSNKISTMTKIVLRLSYYKYYDVPEKEVQPFYKKIIHSEKIYGSKKIALEIYYYTRLAKEMRKKPKILEKLEQFERLTIDAMKSTIQEENHMKNWPEQSIQKQLQEGWVLLEHLERNSLPYKSPESHRSKYLPTKRDSRKKQFSHPFIERKTCNFLFKIGKKRWTPVTVDCIRLRRDPAGIKNILEFINSLDYGAQLSFYHSDYNKEVSSKCQINNLTEKILTIQNLLKIRSQYGHYPSIPIKNNSEYQENKIENQEIGLAIKYYSDVLESYAFLLSDLFRSTEFQKVLPRLILKLKENESDEAISLLLRLKESLTKRDFGKAPQFVTDVENRTRTKQAPSEN